MRCPTLPPPTLLLTVSLLAGSALNQTSAAQSVAQSVAPTPATAATTSTPLTLETALERLAQAPSVTQATLSVKVAQDNLNAARTALGLSISVTGNSSYTGPYNTTASDGTVTTTASSLSGAAGAQVSLGILPWSTNQNSLRAAQRALNLSLAQLKTSEASARLNVAQQYFAAVLANQDLDLAGRTLALRQRQLTVALGQQAAGNATTETVLTAQANVQAAQTTQLQAQANLDAARRSLGAALGQDIGEVSFTTQPETAFTLPDVTALIASARSGRSDVIDAQNTLQAAQDALATQQRNITLPDLSATVRYGPSGSGGLTGSLNLQQGTASVGYTVPFGAGSTGSANRVSASVSGSYVVYSPAQRAELSAAQATVTQAQLTLNVEQQTVELDVRTKYNTAQSALLTMQTKESAVQIAQSTLATTRTRLQAGTVTADDVTTAELALLQAQRDLIAARISVQTALVALQNAAAQ